MDYRRLVQGVNLYNSETDSTDRFPSFPYSPAEPDYDEALEVARTSLDPERIVLFLNRWKCRIDPDRVKFGKALHAAVSLAKSFAEGGLLDVPVDENQTEIERTFNLLDPYAKHVGAAKTLHILFPRHFVAWDNPIAEFYGVSTNARGYGLFLAQSRRELIEVRDSLVRDGLTIENLLTRLYGSRPKTICKVLDEFNWTAISKGWSGPKTWG